MIVNKNNKGFTLMELLIVIVVLGVLAGVALPVYSGFVARAEKSEALGFLDAIRASEMRYFAETGDFGVNADLDFNPNDEVAGQKHAFVYNVTATTGPDNFVASACVLGTALSACLSTATVPTVLVATADPAGARIL
ncbi:MAG: prepilin-type N-terminal cleavage/methylation domain-containing protein [Candidatus Omnitrophota bacterium]|jgi:prepilin-type N-terminal cleavage/methylation domain-containing protein